MVRNLKIAFFVWSFSYLGFLTIRREETKELKGGKDHDRKFKRKSKERI